MKIQKKLMQKTIEAKTTEQQMHESISDSRVNMICNTLQTVLKNHMFL